MRCATPGTISRKCVRPWAAERSVSRGRRPGGLTPLPDLADPPRILDVHDRVRSEPHEVRPLARLERAPVSSTPSERAAVCVAARIASSGEGRPARRDPSRSRRRGPGTPTCPCPARRNAGRVELPEVLAGAIGRRRRTFSKFGIALRDSPPRTRARGNGRDVSAAARSAGRRIGEHPVQEAPRVRQELEDVHRRNVEDRPRLHRPRSSRRRAGRGRHARAPWRRRRSPPSRRRGSARGRWRAFPARAPRRAGPRRSRAASSAAAASARGTRPCRRASA